MTRADDEEDRGEDQAAQHRIEAERAVDHVGDVGADDDERGMGDVDDVELAEGDREAERDRRIEAAEQQARDDGVQQQLHQVVSGRRTRPSR